MKIDVTQVLHNLKGEPLYEINPETQEKEGITLRTILSGALLNMPTETDGSKKAAAWVLAMKIYEAETTVEITTTECAELKNKVGKQYTPMIVGQAWNMLEKAAD